MPVKDIDLRIDIKRGCGIERIQVFADDNSQREASLRALLAISTELDEIERKITGTCVTERIERIRRGFDSTFGSMSEQ